MVMTDRGFKGLIRNPSMTPVLRPHCPLLVMDTFGQSLGRLALGEVIKRS